MPDDALDAVIGSNPDPRAAARRRSNLRGAAFLACFVLAAGSFAVYSNRRVIVIVDNPSPVAFRFRIDGGEWTDLAPGTFQRTSAWRGKHSVAVEAGEDRETFEADWNPSGISFGATYVCDPLQAGAYVIYQVAYGPATTQPPEHHLCERSFPTRSIDCVFTDPPDKVQVKRGQSTTRRVLKREVVRPALMARALIDKKQADVAIRLLERHLERSDDPELIVALATAHHAKGDGDPFQKWLEKRLAWTPEAVTAHRFQQDRLRARGAHDELDRIYRAAPNDAVGTYLRGRAAPTSREALERYKIATSMDESLPWPWMDLGEELLEAGQPDEAVAAFKRFAELRRGKTVHPPEELWRALFVTRRWKELEHALAVSDEPFADAVRAYRLIAMDAPDSSWAPFHEQLRTKRGPFGWIAELLVDRARWNGDHAAAEKQILLLGAANGDKTDAFVLRAGLLLAMNERAKAGEHLERIFSKPQVPRRAIHLALLAGIGDEWAGDDGRRWFDLAEQAAHDHGDHEIARFLTGRATAGELAAGDRHRALDARSAARLARALRAREARERRVLLDEALALAAWDMSDAGFLVRHVFTKSSPSRR